VALFVMVFKVVLSFESVDEILKCDHSNKSYTNDEDLKRPFLLQI